MHNLPHPLAGKTVHIQAEGTDPEVAGQEYRVEDWWDRVSGGSWMSAQGNPAAMKYAIRSGLQDNRLPTDDEVVYGKIRAFGHLIHASELVTDAN